MTCFSRSTVLLIKVPSAAASLCAVESPQVPSSKEASPLSTISVLKAPCGAPQSENQPCSELSQAAPPQPSPGWRRKEGGNLRGEVAIINFLCVHFTHTVNLSLKGIIYSPLHRLLGSQVKDWGYGRVCNPDEKAEKSVLLQTLPSLRALSSSWARKELSIKARRKLHTI